MTTRDGLHFAIGAMTSAVFLLSLISVFLFITRDEVCGVPVEKILIDL